MVVTKFGKVIERVVEKKHGKKIRKKRGRPGMDKRKGKVLKVEGFAHQWLQWPHFRHLSFLCPFCPDPGQVVAG